MRKGHFLCITVFALLTSLACRSMPLSATAPAPTPTLSNTLGDVKASASDCALTEIEDFLDKAGRLDWSPKGDWIAYDKRGADGYDDMYRIQPDGTDNECLTCNHPDLPNKHIGNPAFHPDGRWLLFQAEKENHEWAPSTSPGRGAYNDLYVMDLDSESPYEVYQLTDVRSGYPVGGSLHAHFSRDGEQLLWGDLEGGAGCYGDLRIAIADTSTMLSTGFDDEDPALTNVTYYEPGDNTEWYEMEDWSLDDSGIYFSCAPLTGQDDRTMDFCYMDLETEELTRLTETSGLSGELDEWEEHGKITPLGDAITWMTSTGYEINYSNCKHIEWLETDLWIKNTDGTGKTKLTHYNEPGYPEYDPGGVCVSDMSWNPEGTKLAVEVYFRGIQTPKMKIFHFSRCGDGVCEETETAETCPQDCGKDYEAVSITTLTTDGGRVDWSHDGEWIYYDHLELDSFWDVHRIHPDGTGDECLTCDRPELPNNNQGQPQMHPNGRYLVFQAEKAEHAGIVGDPATGPGGGYFNDLWALDFETGSFHQLTDVRSDFPAGGSLHSHFSNDGTKLLWSDLEGPGGRFGDRRLAVADFVTSPSPHLENYQYYNPGPQPIWLEAHGWGPDDSWIYFTCTPVAGMDDNNQDICRMDFSNPTEVTRLTFTSGLNEEPGEWDEHAHLSPLRDAFSWISSTPYGTESIGSHGQWLRTELWLMNTDGSNQRRITFFNETEQVIVADNDWNPSATLRAGPATGNQQLAVSMFMRDRNETHIKIVEFSVGDASEETIVVDAAEVTGTIRSLQGINAGPRGEDRQSHLFRQYEDIGVDYVRTHDYYGPSDMHVLFPDLQADPQGESSYDFVSTDRELEAINRVGAEVLFRLGESWGSPVTYVAPQDHAAWAQAAVHIAMHYNDGWADGFHWDIEYWEVWNEPDITQFWTGTREEYFQLYEAVARALTAYDPTFKVGGPSWCCDQTFFKDFLAYCRDHDVPLDFVSWHYYGGPIVLLERALGVQQALDTYGFSDVENLLTEWNISVEVDYEHLRDATGAAYTELVLSNLQDTTVTIANRYRGDGVLGMFSTEGFYYKPAYSFLAFHWMLETPQRLAAEGPWTYNWSALSGRDVDGEMVQILISDYASKTTSFDLTVTNLPWDAAQPYHYERYLLDETHNLTLVESADVPAGSDSFTTSEDMIAPAVQLIRLFIPAGEPTPQITIHADQTLDPISPLLYGLNHRYLNSGYGVWDAEAQQVHPEVISRSLEIGFPVTRFPGGTVGGTYHWTDGIGRPEERPLGISGFDGAPATNEYGFDEQMLFMEQVGATTNVVVNFGTGTAQEAAAFVAYANGDPADTTPIGVDELGVDWGTVGEWAAQRETNQVRLGMSPHPYNIEYWEVGNELYGDWEYSWTHGPVKYAAGGTAWQYDQRVVKADDWRDSVSRSSGQPSQVFYVRYPPVVSGMQTITVSGVAWTEVLDLSAAGPDDTVYEFDPQSGEIRFGDGVHGRIPPLAAAIRAAYESGPHDGFVDYYAVMKAVDPDVKVGSCFYSDTFLQAMGEEYPYDFLAVHPYYSSGDYGGNGLTEAHVRTMAGPLIRQMDWEDLQAAVQLYAGERADQVEIAITEYNLYVSEQHSPTPRYGMSLDQGLFVADMVRTMIELGVPLGDLHCLISIYEGEEWGNTAVMSPYLELILRPAAYVLQLFNQHFAPVRVESGMEGAPLLTGSLPALEVVASTDEVGDRLTLLAINKEVTSTITATIAISGFTPAATVQVWTLNGSDITAFNDTGHPTDVMVTESSITDADQSFVYPFPAHSVTLIELLANSSQPTPTPTATPSPTPTPTATCTPTPTLTATPSSRLYLPLILRAYTPPTPSSSAIVLADRPGGLEMVSAAAAIPLTVGHVAYLPVEVQDYHRPITVSAQTLIHTFVNDLTPPKPGESHPFTAGTLEASQNELKLQTLRMRTHALTLTFTAGEDVVSTTLTLEPAVQPRTPLFGLHSSPYYDGLPAPFIPVWGPDCGSCPTTPGDPPGSTRDVLCAKQQDSCHCHHLQLILDPRSDEATRRQAPEMQRYASQFLRSLGGWGSIQIEPGEYLWTGLDWVFNELLPLERDYSPLFSGIMDGNFSWMTCPEYANPDGSLGFFDPNNTYLLEQYRTYVRDLTSRYSPELRFIEMSNEPAAEFYLCPCGAPGGPPCDATSGPNQPACLTGPNSSEFVATYGDLLFTAADAAAEEFAAANPEALLITGALEMVGTRDTDLTETTEYMISQGLLEHGNVAIGIHQYPYLYPPSWISPTLNCAYYQVPGDPFWLPAGCETAPPFDDYTTPAGRPVQARQAWQDFDQRVDSSGLLHDAEAWGVLERFYLFDTELHAGFHDSFGGEPNPSTTPAREALAGLRIGAINAHQRVLGSEFVFAPSDPAAYNLMVKHLAGATPVYDWEAPLMDASYDGLVYKLFTRGDEDIIALWSNAEAPLELILTPSPDATNFKQVTLTSLADAHGPLSITVTDMSALPAIIPVQPLQEFHFLSVISDRPGFGWLADLQAEAGLTRDKGARHFRV